MAVALTRVVVDWGEAALAAALFPSIEVVVVSQCEVVPARSLSDRTLRPSPQRVVG